MIGSNLLNGNVMCEKIIFAIYKSGISKTAKSKIRKKKNDIIADKDKMEEFLECEYFENKSIYSQLCEEYWRNIFNIWNKSFKKYIKLQPYYVENQNYEKFFLNEVDICSENKIYHLSYDYKLNGEDTIIMYFNFYKDISKEESNNRKYDKFLEELKIEVMEFWMKEMKIENSLNDNCYWIEDTQSEKLCSEAYIIINRIENKLRSFINKVMIKRYGLAWSRMFEKSNNEERNVEYKDTIQLFSKINSFLLGLNATDLKKIMIQKKGKRISDKENNTLNECFSYLFNYSYKFIGEKDIKDINVESLFIEQWSKLCKYRNHIAHNKFIEYKSYCNIVMLGNKINILIHEAEAEFNSDAEEYIYVEDELTREMITLKYKNKAEREIDIYYEVLLILRCLRRVKYTSDTVIKTNKKFRRLHKKLRSRDGLEMILRLIDKYEEIELIKIQNNLKENLLTIKLEKIIGTELTNYSIEAILKNGKKIITTIGHDGYNFICDGVPENHQFIGGEWEGFCGKIENEMNVYMREKKGLLSNKRLA